MDEFARARRILTEILSFRPDVPPVPVTFEGAGDLPSAFAVSDFAAAAVAAAGIGVADVLTAFGGCVPALRVDRCLASRWFASSIAPRGWPLPPVWDAIAGDYAAADGWIKLHTNAPHHRAAALKVLDCAAEREAVAAAVARREAVALEEAIVAAGGCAAAMRTTADWLASDMGRAIAAEPLIDWRDEGAAAGLDRAVDPARPLAGVRVLDVTRVLAGPVATRFLAGLGADVLRIDPPHLEEPSVLPETLLGKRSARLDLRTAEGRHRFEALLSGCDLLVHGYRPGALEGLGFGAVARRALNPGLIDVSLDAYGWTGPWRGRRGFDSLVQMSTGLAEAGMRHFSAMRPVALPVQALDHATGYLMAFAALSALAARRRSGRALSARLSLARTAHLLLGHPMVEDGAGFAEPTADDWQAEIEATGWGPAARLKMPLAIKGVAFAYPHPARPLGGDGAAW